MNRMVVVVACAAFCLRAIVSMEISCQSRCSSSRLPCDPPWRKFVGLVYFPRDGLLLASTSRHRRFRPVYRRFSQRSCSVGAPALRGFWWEVFSSVGP
jgi:hypothetical protein